MEFLGIGESKLKIVMTEKELTDYGISAFADGKQDAKSRRRFWEVLGRARDEVGFDPARDKVLVQFYPMKTGGLEIFVTKLGLLAPESARLVSRSERVTLLSRSECVYSFTDEVDMSLALALLYKLSGDSTPRFESYYLNGIYYLIVEEYTKGDEPTEFIHLSEFGTQLTADLAVYIREHGCAHECNL